MPKRPFSVEENLQQLVGEAHADACRRLEDLRLMLNGRPLRDDSRLAFEYAVGNIDRPIHDVAQEILLVDDIFNKTAYGKTVEGLLKDVAARIQNDKNISWKQTWSIVRRFGPTVFKLDHIQELLSSSDYLNAEQD